MSADIYGGITVALNDAPIRTEYDHGIDGRPLARLVIGEPGKSIAITVTNSSPDTVDQLAEAVAQLAAWTKRQALKEVA
ncbi:hypothetical protein ACIF8T_21915 [Streptomyces sp. NPDC085946]|uniref:hypothetical protein n=1 Tax=Streptomyces sp. NPDC085946 TaxID=3365744 RepID=UPI0037CCDC63